MNSTNVNNINNNMQVNDKKIKKIISISCSIKNQKESKNKIMVVKYMTKKVKNIFQYYLLCQIFGKGV